MLTDLVDIAREAKEYGVGAMQIIGWTAGGQDGDVPYIEPHPMLGTQEELRQAIADIEALGIRTLMFCKFKWADRTTDRYREELGACALRDPYGQPVFFDGYGYQTMSQMMTGGTRRTGAGMCHNSENFREIALREFQKILDLNPSGISYDELSNHMLFCLAENHGHGPGASNHQGTLKLSQEFDTAARNVNPDFLMAGEGPNDRLAQIYHINYIRSWDGSAHGEPEHRPAWKYIDPDMHFATCLSGFDDREMVNQCIAFGYLINYEPYHFKGRPSDVPLTLEYGAKAQQLREELRAYLWEGEFLGLASYAVKYSPADANVLMTQFRSRKSGHVATVIVNQEKDRAITAETAGKTIYTIEDTDKSATISPRSFAVLC